MKESLAETLAALEELKGHANDLGLFAEISKHEAEDEDDEESYSLKIDIDNGRSKQPLFVREASRARTLLGVKLDEITFLGEYSAFLDRVTGNIEAFVGGVGPAAGSRAPFRRIPGMISVDEPLQEDGYSRRIGKLSLEDSGRRINLGESSEVGKAILGERFYRPASMHLIGFDIHRHDEAVRILEEVSGALFFDFDVMYGALFSLRRRAKRATRVFQSPSKKDPAFPKTKYARQALSLYEYGRSARGLPLLEFLAYYQAVEFFFPAFAHADASNALRTELLNPRFDPSSNADLSRLIKLAAPAVKAGIGERDQLRATLRSATSLAGLRAAVERVGTADGNLLTDKGSKLKGVIPLQIDKDNLSDQLADRIYAIRCRIVHAKADGGPSNEELLLPTSEESEVLWADISVLRYVAQQAIFSQSQRL